MGLPKFEDLISKGTWNRRYKELEALLHEGPEARKLVIDVINHIREIKDLNFGERKMFDIAQNYEEYKVAQDEKVKNLAEFRKKRYGT